MAIVPAATTKFIWFGTRAVQFEGGGSTGPQIELLDSDADFATRALPGGKVADFTGSEWQQFLAFSGTAAEQAALGIDLANGVDTATAGAVNTTGDLRVGAGVTAHNIADSAGGGRLIDTSGSLDESDDPLTITGLGKASAGILGGATTEVSSGANRVVFSNDLGFGFINGSGFDPGGNALRLNDGDAINFAIGQGRLLSQASFTVKVLSNGSTEVVVDSDGATIRDTNNALHGGFVQDGSTGELNLGVLAHDTKVTINYLNQTIWFNDTTQFLGDSSGFFSAFGASGSKNLTLGSVVGNQIGWSADNLVLATENAPPVASPPTGGIGDEDTVINGDVGATDPNGDPLTYTVETADGPANGSVVVNSADGSYSYTPNANYNGPDSFTVTISDGQGGVTTQEVQITVLPVNDAPVAAGYTGGTGNEDTAIAGDVNGSDVDGNTLTYTVAGGDGPANGSVVVNAADGTFTYTPNANYNGGDGFTVTISDGNGGTATQVVNITVLPVNDAPVAAGYTGGTGNEDTAIAGDVNASDVDGNTLTYTVAGGDGPANGSVAVNAADGTFTYTPNANYNGGDGFTVTISDGNGGTATQVVNITVNAVNDAATIIGTSTGSVTEDVGVVGGNLSKSGALSISDPDAGEAFFNTTVTSAVGNLGTLAVTATGAWSYSVSNAAVQYLGAGATKTETFTVQSLDGSDTQNIIVTINGAAEPVVAVSAINLDNLNGSGTGGYKIIGESESDDSGTAIASVADLNGDGKAEVIIGAPDDDDAGSNGGAAYVVWGKGTTGEINLDTIETGSGGYKIIAETSDDEVGFSVASIGDLNGDGKAEVVVGAISAAGGGDDGGAVYVVFGKGTTGEINLDNVAAGTGGFKIYGEEDNDQAGYSVAAAGDVNGDGKADILLGAVGDDDSDGSNGGAAYVVFGKSTTTAVNLDALDGPGTGGFKIVGENGNDSAGWSVAAAGDLNGDTFADIIVSAVANDGGGTNAGAAYVVFGKSTTGEVNLEALGTGGFKITGESGNDVAGYDVASIGDLNGDGKREIVLGATGAPSEGGDNGGAVYVVWGKSTTTAVNLDDVAAGTGGFKIIGESDNDDAGYAVASIGDLNGDGLGEILIGAVSDDNSGGNDAGAVYVVWGKGTGGTIDLDAVAVGNGGFKIYGESEDDLAGYDVGAIADLNGDGRQEILLTGIGDDDGGSNAGASYVVFSSADWIGAS